MYLLDNYKGADKSLARPTSRCIFYDKNIYFDASLVIYINSINIPPIMIINRIYEHQNLLSLQLVSFLVGLRTYQHPCTNAVTLNTNKIQNAALCWLLSNIGPLFHITEGQLMFLARIYIILIEELGIFLSQYKIAHYITFRKGVVLFLLRHFRFIIHSLMLYKQNS